MTVNKLLIFSQTNCTLSRLTTFINTMTWVFAIETPGLRAIFYQMIGQVAILAGLQLAGVPYSDNFALNINDIGNMAVNGHPNGSHSTVNKLSNFVAAKAKNSAIMAQTAN